MCRTTIELRRADVRQVQTCISDPQYANQRSAIACDNEEFTHTVVAQGQTESKIAQDHERLVDLWVIQKSQIRYNVQLQPSHLGVLVGSLKTWQREAVLEGFKVSYIKQSQNFPSASNCSTGEQ